MDIIFILMLLKIFYRRDNYNGTRYPQYTVDNYILTL